MQDRFRRRIFLQGQFVQRERERDEIQEVVGDFSWTAGGYGDVFWRSGNKSANDEHTILLQCEVLSLGQV